MQCDGGPGYSRSCSVPGTEVEDIYEVEGCQNILLQYQATAGYELFDNGWATGPVDTRVRWKSTKTSNISLSPKSGCNTQK